MRLAVISDSHGNLRNTELACRMLEALEVDRVIHCGDIGSANIPALLKRWPTHYVLGNVDSDVESLSSSILACQHQLHGRFGELELEGVPLAFLHSDDTQLFHEVIALGKYRAVFFGHTHVPESRMQGGTLVFNPGAIHRASRHTFGIIELPQLEAHHVGIDVSF